MGRMFVTLLRIIRFAFQNIGRNLWLSLMTVSMLVLTLVSVNVLLVLNLVGQKALAYVEDRIEVSVYFNAGVPDDKVANAASYLRNLAQVKDVGVVTADEALTRFKDRHAADASILAALDEVGGNPFGQTLVVKAETADAFPFILTALENPQFAADIRDKDFSSYEAIIERIRSITERVRIAGIVLTGIFLAVALLIMFNMIRITIFIHREEIAIMKLVGAGNSFIRLPFLLQSLLLTGGSVLLVAAISYPAIAALEPHLNFYFEGETLGLFSYYTQNGLVIFGAQFLLLAFVNMISTGLAMRKYLKV